MRRRVVRSTETYEFDIAPVALRRFYKLLLEILEIEYIKDSVCPFAIEPRK